jgi:hypothetical protein
MRNLKRALSLTLASVMLLGMMVIGTSAAAGYDDVKETDNVEAIEVLQAVEVMVGDDRGFGPDRPVTRAEMAVVMGKLLNLDYNYYVSTCPFADVSGNFEWARGWVGACYANKILSGRGEGVFDPASTVTAVEAASMMMRALGYFKHAEDVADGFQLATVRQGNQIGIFNGVGTDATTPMTRNQVAQMALNALKANMVDFTGTLGIEVNGVKIGYQGEYTFRTGTEAKYRAISILGNTTDGTTNQSYIQLGEELYDGDLKLVDDRTDAFGRPSRQWEYDGKIIGTYAKTELLKTEYTTEVTGRELYDLLGSDVINSIKKGGSREYALNVTIDGETDAEINGKLFDVTAMNKNNKAGVGDTGNGVLTQVFVDGDKKVIDIAIINTYLARARADYSEKKDEVSFNVYGIDKDKDGNFVKVVDTRDSKDDNNDNRETMSVTGEDFIIDGIKENDAYLVTVAEGEIQTMALANVVEDTTLTSFKRNSNVVADGTTYNYASTTEYDFEVLDQYTTSGGSINLKDKSYNIYLDKYDYMIGIDRVTADDNYVFITGIDASNSDLAATNNKANAVFLDGTMEAITFNVSKSKGLPASGPLVNTWCTYTKDSKDIYTLNAVAAKIDTDNGDKVAQNHDVDTVYIDVKHISLKANGADFARAYGNDNTVYLTAEVKTINPETTKGRMTAIISDVTNVTTGVKNASLEIWNDGAATPAVSQTVAMAEGDKNANITDPANKATAGAYGTYLLYKSNGYIIGAVAVADDSAASKNLVYVTSGNVDEESYDSTNDEWTWTREVAINGEKSSIKEVSDSLTYIGSSMKQYNWYEVKYNAAGEVVLATLASNALTHAVGPTKAQGNEYVDKIEWVEGSINAKDTVLFENSEYNKVTPAIASTALKKQPEGPHMKGSTFFVSKTDTEGFHVDSNVKVVFIQTNDNKTTTSWEEGSSRLESFTSDLNAIGDEYNYEVSAILEGGSAKVVVIRDLNETGDSGNKPDPKPVSKDIFVDLTNPADVMVNSTKAFDTQTEGYDAIIAALEDAGYEITSAEETAANKLDVVTMKNGIKRTFQWDATGTDKCITGKEFKLDGVTMITNATAYPEVDDAITRFIAAASGDEYIRYSADEGKTWTYALANATGTKLGTTAKEVETGYLKVTVNSAAVTNTELNMKESGIVSDAGGSTYALATATAVKGTGATGTGMKVSTSDYMPFGSTFADIHAKDTTTAGVCTIEDVSSVKLTIVNDTVGSEAETVVAQAYNATAQNLSALTGIVGTGTHKYVDSRTGNATLLADTVDVSKDVTVYVGYVKTGKAVVTGTFTGVTVAWDNDLKDEPVMKVGTTITATVTFNKPTIANNALTFTASAGKAGGFACDVTGLKNTPDSATKWTSPAYSVAVADSGKMEGTVKISFVLDNATATATPTLTIAGGT